LNIYYHPSKWQSSGLTRAFAVMAGAFFVTLFSGKLFALDQKDAENIPHVSSKAKDNFVLYQSAGEHKAFAIAPGGAWYWVTEAVSEEQAEQQALDNCQKNTQQKCVLYALNDRIAFDAKKWPGLWGPYSDSVTAEKAAAGVGVGQRYPDLTWLDNKGRRISLSEQKGKIVFLHFWGSWCPPCLREFPSLQTLHKKIQDRYSRDIEMVMIQLREPFDESKKWVDRYGFSGMPIYDSGIKDSETTTLTLSDGSQIRDRDIARVFPSTYVIDRNGLVLFSHSGPVSNWLDYIGFLEHAVKATEKSRTSIADKNTGNPGS